MPTKHQLEHGLNLIQKVIKINNPLSLDQIKSGAFESYYLAIKYRLERALSPFLLLDEISTILDVCRSRREYTASLIASGYNCMIYSFEPLPEIHVFLADRTKEHANHEFLAPYNIKRTVLVAGQHDQYRSDQSFGTER